MIWQFVRCCNVARVTARALIWYRREHCTGCHHELLRTIRNFYFVPVERVRCVLFRAR